MYSPIQLSGKQVGDKMKLHTERSEVERSGVASESTFRIKTTAKAFDILSSGLYTDPKLAIVRELSCNAWDAHVAAGKTHVPFEIHLPNSLEPYLSIRDHGTGLSDENIQGKLVDVVVYDDMGNRSRMIDADGNVVQHRQGGLYTTYFESTKTDSNDFIGALGLGSKSPFSYTKAFEVISRFDGVKRIYSAFINEEGLPAIAQLGEIATDEDNGLEVRITIQNTDFQVFKEKTATALRWFPVKPIVSGYANFKWPDVPKERLEGNGWKMFETGFAGDYSKMSAVQGNVGYKVDITKLALSVSDTKILESSHLVGFFNIGDLEVAANREEIRYDDRSRDALIAKIKEARAGVLASIEAQVDTFKDKPFWYVVIELNMIAKKVFNDRNLFKTFVKDSQNATIQRYLKIDGEFHFSQTRGHDLSGFETSYSSGSITTKRRTIGNGITPEANVKIFYNDLPTGGIARVMQWVKAQPGKVLAIVIRPVKDYEEVEMAKGDGKILSKRAWTEAEYVTELVKLRAELGDVEFLTVSKDTPIPSRVRSTYKAELPVFQFGGIKGRYKKYVEWRRAVDVDLAEGGLYFRLENGAHVSFINSRGILQNVKWSMRDVEGNISVAVSLINQHLGTKYHTSDVYGFGSQALPKIKKNEKWIDIFTILAHVVDAYVEPNRYFAALELTSTAHGLKETITHKRDKKFVAAVTALADGSVFKQAILPLIEDQAKYAKYEESVRFVQQIDVDLETKKLDNSGIKGYFNESAFKAYPMFRFVSSVAFNNGTADLDALFEYITMIDRS